MTTVYLLKNPTPYSKIKEKNDVFELSNLKELEQAIIDHEGDVFIEDTKVYLLTKTNRGYVLFYDDIGQKMEIYNQLKELANGGMNANRSIQD